MRHVIFALGIAFLMGCAYLTGVLVATPASLEPGYVHGEHCMDMNVF